MPEIGFSTGALFKGAMAQGVAAAQELRTRVVELSALRLKELQPLLDFVRATDLGSFAYVSVHAPTDHTREQEAEVARALAAVAIERHWFVVVHPDCLWNYDLWRPFGRWLCIENMDKRKDVGRTVEELKPLFEDFPQAAFCFDIGHAHQVDTSMTESYRILREFRDRICQLHMSEVTSSSKHDRMSDRVLEAFHEVAELLPDVPVILETPVTTADAPAEIEKARSVFRSIPAGVGFAEP